MVPALAGRAVNSSEIQLQGAQARGRGSGRSDCKRLCSEIKIPEVSEARLRLTWVSHGVEPVETGGSSRWPLEQVVSQLPGGAAWEREPLRSWGRRTGQPHALAHAGGIHARGKPSPGPPAGARGAPTSLSKDPRLERRVEMRPAPSRGEDHKLKSSQVAPQLPTSARMARNFAVLGDVTRVAPASTVFSCGYRITPGNFPGIPLITDVTKNPPSRVSSSHCNAEKSTEGEVTLSSHLV
ncbi:uncharacterized protein LOC119234741 [Talpa occidentalis]|uniref:uncharacterized protein LOC119234741 n=1 Tax=Talpa occidentalis TaxID=50954 RepID=UPI0023F91FE4|nr:uncharacterized protein LOC119234741 [Talpa occidentalis]